jgi:anthranilate phosphoribosyltransferase
MQSYYIEPSEYGIDVSDEDAASKVGGDVIAMAEESAGLIQSYLDQSAPEAYRDMVFLNAGLRIYAGGKAERIDDGYRIARQVYEDGKVKSVFESGWSG